MRAKQNNRPYDGNEVRYTGADGQEERADDIWFEDVVDMWEREGVPSEIVRMARPLLDGNRHQQEVAEKFLLQARGSYRNSAHMQVELMRVMSKEGVTFADPGRVDDDAMLKAWDEQMGPISGNNSGNVSLGTSDYAKRSPWLNAGGPSTSDEG